MERKPCRESRVVKTSLVLPNDTNNHGTLFGGRLMAYIDDVASISAMRHCRQRVVTASVDTVNFLFPIHRTDSVCLESYVTWTGHSSMEVFVKVITEDLFTGERKIAATAFSTFVALDENFHPVPVPEVYPESEEEKKLHETAPERVAERKQKRIKSKELADYLTLKKPWE